MNKNEMINRMKDIAFKARGVELQLSAEYILRASAATTAEERNKCMDALLNLVIPVKALVTMSAIIARVHPEGLDVDELPEPFNELEKMTEEEIAEWIMAQIKLAKEGMTE